MKVIKTYEEVSDSRYHYLKDFQSKRLAGAYTDFTARPEYRAACFFFFNRLYSTEDTGERDEAFRKVYNTIKKYLGGDVVKSMAKLIELQEITIEMDHKILELLEDKPPEFDMDTYERAYRVSNNYALRIRQIELLDLTIHLVHRVSHRFGIGLVLRALHGACLLRGDTRMVDFLMDGYKAFADLDDIDPLATAMVVRETTRLNRIYGFNGGVGATREAALPPIPEPDLMEPP